MEYRRLGNSGLQVSVVGLGTNNFGGRTDAQQADRVVRQAIEVGINMVDTSDSYGNGLSEEYIGKSIKGIRSQVVLATKFHGATGKGPNQRGTSRIHIIEAVEKSLKLLGTDYIDLYQVHRPDFATPIEETLRTLDDLVRQGKVLYIGCSNFPAWRLAEAAWTARSLHLETFISAQPEYNMLDRRAEREVVPCCQAYGLGILPYYPLASGFLTGKYHRGQPAPEGTRLAGNARAQQSTLTGANFDVLERLETFAIEREHTMVELAIAWLLATPAVSSVIAGATKPEQVVDNAKAAAWHLTPQEKQQVDDILDAMRRGS
ncbi:MAG: aldo/keto reductase [Dehalococcoidia bacterium]|nr:aldo/keto reductase [Dehalococcoidia bacterium]